MRNVISAERLMRVRVWVVGLILAVLLFSIYGHTLFGRKEYTGFAWVDDQLVFIENPHLAEPWDVGGLQALVSRPYSYDWTPAYWALIWVERGLFGNQAVTYRGVSLIAFWLSMLVLYSLYKRWTDRPGLAFFLVCLLTANPMIVEAVAWPTTQKTVLSLLFAVVSLWCYHQILDGGSGKRLGLYYAALVAAVLLALGVKMRGVVLPFGLLVYELCYHASRGHDLRRVWTSSIRRVAPIMALALGWAAYNYLVIFKDSAATGQYDAYLGGSLGTSIASHWVIEWRTLGYWFVLWKRFFHYGYRIYDFSDWQPWVAVAGFVAVLSGLSLCAPRRVRRWAVFCALWYLIQRSLTAGILPNQWGVMHDRYSLVASIGWIGLLGLALLRAIEHPVLGATRRARVWLACTLVLVSAAFSNIHATWLLMEAGRTFVSDADNVFVKFRKLMTAHDERLDTLWDQISNDPRAGITIGGFRLAKAAVRWGVDRVHRGFPAPDDEIAWRCEGLPTPHREFLLAYYYGATDRPDRLWMNLRAGLRVRHIADWLGKLREDLKAGRKRDWRKEFLRIGDGTARHMELKGLEAVLKPAYESAASEEDRNLIIELAQGVGYGINSFNVGEGE